MSDLNPADENSVEDFEWIEGCGVDFSVRDDGKASWSTFLTPVGFGLDGPFGPFDSRDAARKDAEEQIKKRAEIYSLEKVMSGEQSFDD